MSEAPVREGDVVAGKYRIERVLGVGGMGVVVAATHLPLDPKVALEFLLPEATQNEDVVARFAREARAAVKIQSEHVARVIDVGTLETGSPYMVMEDLPGRDLSALLEERKVLSAEEAVGFVGTLPE
jgi:serine/threonine-protein kinase